MDDKDKIKVPKKLNTKKVNELIGTGNKILKILYILFIILLLYVLGLILKEWKILTFFIKLLRIISPLFIGWLIAWLLNPLVKRLQARGMKRITSVIIVYAIVLVIIALISVFTISSMGTQISEIVSSIPKIVNDVKDWIDNIFVKLSNLSLQNLDSIKMSFLNRIDIFSASIQTSLPTTALNIISGLVSGVGTILLSLIIGIYILFDFDKFSTGFVELFPKHIRGEVERLLGLLNNSLYSFISGTLWLSLLLFVVSVIGFSIIGLNAPVLVAFVCVITNLIPYIGPYLGAAVAAAIGFSQGPLIGVLTLIFIFVVQTIEGNVLQPLVMSKKMNLSPITIIISLLVFEYLFGIVGMVVATPVVALLKIIYNFFDEKYNFFGKEKDEE